jgi:hypothetical protein
MRSDLSDEKKLSIAALAYIPPDHQTDRAIVSLHPLEPFVVYLAATIGVMQQRRVSDKLRCHRGHSSTNPRRAWRTGR